MLPNWTDFVVSSILQEFIATLASIGAAFFIRSTWLKWKYGGWEVIVKYCGEDVVHRSVSAAKTRIVLDEEADLSVFLKGVASPYDQINIDLVSKKSKEIGLLTVDHAQKHFIVDLDKNPPKNESMVRPRL